MTQSRWSKPSRVRCCATAVHLMGLIGIKNKDDYTFLHSVSVCTLMIAFGRSLGLDGDELRQGGHWRPAPRHRQDEGAGRGAQQAGRLTDAEFDLIKQHPG
jgi:HD-GYP domain-containing protein (c-di-GMP phosphodiesterase class II)